MSKYVLIVNKDEVSLIRTLMKRNYDFVIAKIRLYEYLDRNGEYHSSLGGYRKLKVRYESILKKLIIKEK